jgi:hypothetical protein
VTDGVDVVTPQARDDLWAMPVIIGFGWLLQALYLLCFYCVYKEIFLGFAGMTGSQKK